MNKIQPIQIIGTQRSGSNLLRVMLNQYSEITAPHPPHILQRFIPLLPNYDDLEIKGNMYNLVNDVCRLIELNPVSWTGLVLDRQVVLSQCEAKSLFEIFRVIYDLKATNDASKFWVCKSMTNVHFSDELEASDIKPFYIHLYRDGRDVACSFKKAVVGEKHIYNIANQWKNDQDACLELKNKIDKKRFLAVKYEDLISSSVSEMKRISAFLNLNFEPTVLDFYKSEESKNTALAGQMWKNLSKPILKNNTNKYKTQLSVEEVQIFENQAATNLTSLGYQLDYQENHLPQLYCEDTIKRFDEENNLLKAKAKQNTDPQKQQFSKGQDSLMNELKNSIQPATVLQVAGV